MRVERPGEGEASRADFARGPEGRSVSVAGGLLPEGYRQDPIEGRFNALCRTIGAAHGLTRDQIAASWALAKEEAMSDGERDPARIRLFRTRLGLGQSPGYQDAELQPSLFDAP